MEQTMQFYLINFKTNAFNLISKIIYFRGTFEKHNGQFSTIVYQDDDHIFNEKNGFYIRMYKSFINNCLSFKNKLINSKSSI